jgi:hypothetical protein
MTGRCIVRQRIALRRCCDPPNVCRLNSLVKVGRQRRRIKSLVEERVGAFRLSGCFQPARGVIHPSFPLRGRWGRPALVDE